MSKMNKNIYILLFYNSIYESKKKDEKNLYYIYIILNKAYSIDKYVYI